MRSTGLAPPLPHLGPTSGDTPQTRASQGMTVPGARRRMAHKGFADVSARGPLTHGNPWEGGKDNYY